MKISVRITAICLLWAVWMFVGAAQAGEETKAAVDAAREWLSLVDAGKYKQSWQEAAPFFREQVKEPAWVAQLSEVRGPLGAAVSRELLGALFTTNLPGAPSGEYVVIQFKTDFAEKPDSIETITPMRTGGAWRVSGYFIK